MAIKQSNAGIEKLKCQDFAKVSGTLTLPKLDGIQTESYQDFLDKGIDEVFNEIFPIKGPNDTFSLEYKGFYFGEPKKSIEECKEKRYIYTAPLFCYFILKNNETGEILDTEGEDGVFLGDFPIMTPTGTFIVNGAERVIVSQITRSAGAYYSFEKDASAKMIYSAEIIPTRGTWIQYENDTKDVINANIDRTRKVPATIFMRALGLGTDEEMIKLFGENPYLLATLEKDSIGTKYTDRDELIRKSILEIHSKVKVGETTTYEGAKVLIHQKFFDAKRYDLGRPGRFKFRNKLGIYNRLINHYIAEPLCDKDGEVIYRKGTFIDADKIKELKENQVFEKGAHAVSLGEGNFLEKKANSVQVIKVYKDETKKEEVKIVATDLRIDKKYITVPDILASFSYFLNLTDGIGNYDDIDNLGNRRIKSVGESLQNCFRIGLTRMEKTIKDRISTAEGESITIKGLINNKPLTSAVKDFCTQNQLSQFMDQTNPLAELTNKRRISALGVGGLTRDRAAMSVRDVHDSHYGRICPIETPEGPNIGLINNLACYAKIDEHGFIRTPYRVVDKEKLQVLEKVKYLSAEDENDVYIAQANLKLNDKHIISEDYVIARHKGETMMVKKEVIDYVDVSPKQIVSVAAACIPFLENDDARRALMGANMQRQAIPLLQPHVPYVGTGMEKIIARDSGQAVVANFAGTVTYVDSTLIEIEDKDGKKNKYKLRKFARSNNGTCLNSTPIVSVGEKIKAGQVIADGPAMENGELALGQNVTVAFMTWQGYNYEDAVIMSERMVKDDVYTSIHIEEYTLDCRETKLGSEEITRDVPYTSEAAKAHLDARGIIIPGTEVKEGDILVGKITPKGQTEPTPVEKMMQAIFGEKAKEGKDSSLRVPHGGAGVVLAVKVFNDKDEALAKDVKESVHVFIVQKRKISEGDKMAGRHGNKGVISRIVPVEDMPYLEDGTPIDILLNPQGVPSRMNIGQVLELHLGMAGKLLGRRFATPVFDGASNKEIADLMKEAEMDPDGKRVLYDGRTGEQFEQRIAVGVMYMIKLSHMVDDKIHARATGPYSAITQQPLGGKAQKGGQRFGEMEVWSLEAFGASHTLQEVLTIKSDDMIGRAKTYEAIIKGLPIPKPGMPEAFRVLQKELQALAIDVRLLDDEGSELSINDLAKQADIETRRINKSFKDMIVVPNETAYDTTSNDED